MGLEISRHYSSYSFFRSGPNFIINTAVIGEYKVMDILAICLKLIILWHFEMGLCVLQCTYVGYFWCPIPWVWFGVIQCTLQNFQFYSFLKPLLLSQFSADSSKLFTRYHNHTGCHFLWRFAKKLQKIWHFEAFLTQDHMQLQFSISPFFIGVHPNFVTTLARPW